MTVKIKFTELMNEKEHRLGYHLGYRTIADETGISLKTIWKLHHNQAGQFEMIDKLCKFFDCQPGDLLEYTE